MDGLRKQREKRGEKRGEREEGRREWRREREGRGKEEGERSGGGGKRRKERGSGRGKKEGAWRVWVRCSTYLCTHLEGQCVEPFRKLFQFAAAYCLTVAIVRKHDISLNVQTCVCIQVALA